MLTVVILSATESMPRDMVRAIHHLRKGRPDGGDTLKGSILLGIFLNPDNRQHPNLEQAVRVLYHDLDRKPLC